MSVSDSASDDREPSSERDEEVHCTPSETVTSSGKRKGGRKTNAPALPEELKPKVLEFLRERPYFYNKAHPLYKDINRRKREWKEFANLHGVEFASIDSWVKSMRTMLSRAMRLKQNGSADIPLPRSLQWVLDNLAFMKPFMIISSVATVPMGPSRRTAAEAFESTEFETDESGPYWKVPRYAEPEREVEVDPAIAGPSGYRPQKSSSCRAPAPAPAAPSASASQCCSNLCAELDTLVQRWSRPFDHFLTNLSWMVEHFTRNQLIRLQNDIRTVTLRHLAQISERPEGPSVEIVPPQVPAVQDPPQHEPEHLKLGDVVVEGKTKVVYAIPDCPKQVLLQSKDRITAGDGARAHDLEGKAAISTATTCAIFELLNNAGIKTHYIKKQTDTAFVARRCAMIPIEWVTRRVATGSFLRRHPGVKEGFRFCPPKLETFFKDDANNDPQWSREQILTGKFEAIGRGIGVDEYNILAQTTVTIFEILEKAWASLDCSLIDMKIEFGICSDTGELVLGDVIDSDSWRLWPAGDKRLMKDKQVYRELQTVTAEALETVKRNFAWVAERVPLLSPKPKARVVVIMGSPSDSAHCEKVRDNCKKLGVPCELRVMSAHKATDLALAILHDYEGEGIPTVFIAVAGRSNGLGPVLSANSTWPVINCPPLSADWGAQDVWSSLRLPSGLGCGTVMSPEAAALNAAQILSLTDHVIWSKLRARKLNTWIDLILADQKTRDDE